MAIKGFKRPRLASELSGSRPQLFRLTKSGRLQHASLNYYYVKGWFDGLQKNDEWTMRDALLHIILQLNNLHRNEALLEDEDPKTVRLVATTLRGPRVIGMILDIADALDARAEALEIQDTPTEATD